MKTGVVPPLGNRHWAKPITIGSASVIPFDRQGSKSSRSSTSDGSSKHFVPSGTIQRSAGAWSIIVVTTMELSSASCRLQVA
jgi:hypothetical protein